MRKLFPSNPVWNHPVFHHAVYATFGKEIESCQDPGIPNKLSMFYQAMPQLADHLTALDARNEQRATEL